MNKKIIPVILLLLLGCILAGSRAAYNRISENVLPDDEVLPQVQVQNTNEIYESGNQEHDPTATAVPDLAADFKVMNSSGNTECLSEHIGKPVIINFWASWCGPCCIELPYFQSAFEEYGNQIDFMMINLTDGQSDTIEGVISFCDDNGFTFPLYYDTEYSASAAYRVYSIPETVWISADGVEQGRHIGALTDEQLNGSITKLLSTCSGNN